VQDHASNTAQGLKFLMPKTSAKFDLPEWYTHTPG